MRFWTSIRPFLALLLLLDPTAGLHAQAASGSPYSSYGFGDLLYSAQAPQALMGGTGIAYTEPFSVMSSNPASYVGLLRPTFEGGVRGLFMTQHNATGSVRRTDADFMGFSLGVPFARGRWGLAFGLTPFSDVGYSITDKHVSDEGTTTYEYTGSGGLNRVFAGVSHLLWQQKADTLGNLGRRLTFGANFDFLFGGIEQTRKAIYPSALAYTNTSIYSSLVLHAPTGSVGLQFSSQFISRATVERAIARKEARRSARTVAWRAAHPGEAPPHADHTRREAEAWRFTLGATAGLPARFNALSTDLVTTYRGTGTTIDTVPSAGDVSGSLTLPIAYGFGISVHDARWLFTAEARRRDWHALKVDLEGYTPPGQLNASTVYALGARFVPSSEGGLFHRTMYRAGMRYTNDYLQVHDTPLTTTSFSLGASLPLNAIQTNSYVHLGVEFAQRGTTIDALLREDIVYLWVGVSITPWKGERWFKRYQIQ